jgi:hypothetical protein
MWTKGHASAARYTFYTFTSPCVEFVKLEVMCTWNKYECLLTSEIFTISYTYVHICILNIKHCFECYKLQTWWRREYLRSCLIWKHKLLEIINKSPYFIIYNSRWGLYSKAVIITSADNVTSVQLKYFVWTTVDVTFIAEIRNAYKMFSG